MNAQKTKKLLQENRNTIFLILIIILSLALLYYVLFVNKQTSRFFGNNIPTPTPKHYAKLDAVLNKVVAAADPYVVIKDNHIAMDKNGFKVYIIVNSDSFIFLPLYGKQIDRTGRFIQAIVTSKQLEDLAKNSNIDSIQGIKDSSNIPKGVNIKGPKPFSEGDQNNLSPLPPTITP
jgi:hypothetical protein